MKAAMPLSRRPSHPVRARRPARALLGVGMLVLLAGPAANPALAADSGTATSTPTFPVPASAKANTTSAAPAPSAGNTATVGAVAAPATSSTATTPTTPTTTTAPPASGVQTSTAPVGAAPSATQPTTGSRAVVVHTQADTTSRLSGAAIAAAVLAALIALGCLAWGVARMLAYEPRWTLSLRHVMAEASFRASATWAELTDWARLGR